MFNKLALAGGIILLVAIGWFAFEGATKETPQIAETDIVRYGYTCDDGSAFSMTPAADISSINLRGSVAGLFSDTAQLEFRGGARFENGPLTFTGAGEEVTITNGTKTVHCNPVPSTESAPWNWGDAAEGGGTKQNVALIVSESIVGSWRSAEDAKFVREFGNGMVRDLYDGAVVSSGTATFFTREKPLDVPFPLEENAVYLQLVMTGTQAEKLNFRLITLSPETLEMTYLARGGTLRFTRVQ